MNNKEKIKLLEKFIKNPGGSQKNFYLLPRELQAEVGIEANILGIKNVEGALIYVRELKREERDKEITQTQKQQSKILQEQQKFTKVLAVATCILAIGAIVHLYFYVLFGIRTIELSRITATILGGVIGGFFGIAFYSLFKAWGIFKSKKKK